MSRKPALTLVELLASLAIVTMLVVAALGVATSLARSELAIRKMADGKEALRPALKSLVGADLVHAHRWRTVGNGFALQAHMRLTSKALRLEHVPSVVTYRVRRIDQVPYLVRVQETAPDPPQAGLVAAGVTDIVLVPMRDARSTVDGWETLAGGCTVRVTVETGGGPREIEVRMGREGPNEDARAR